jgi:hypothetical protein
MKNKYKTNILCIKNFGGKASSETPLQRSRHRQKDNVKLDLKQLSGQLCNGGRIL